MKIAIKRERVLDQLGAEESCIGAAFASYSFDPQFFEHHVLRAVLQLASDPSEQPERYHAEAVRALQEAPVVAIVDGGQRQPGRRLPYDLLDVSGSVFHPKSALVLYQNNARLMVGSGNLTYPGYNENTELFVVLKLAYDDPGEVALLRAYNAHLGRIAGMTRQRGSQLALFRKELERRLGEGVATAGALALTLLDSTTAPIMDRVLELLPVDAKIQRVGMLAPFYERDDVGEPDELEAGSVFGALQPRASRGTILDVGVAWDNAQVEPHTVGDIDAVEDGLDRLWAWGREDQAGRVVDYLAPTSVGRSALVFVDARGNRRRRPMDEVRTALGKRSLWMLPAPEAFAPRRAIDSARQVFGDVRMWLHPLTRLLEGVPVHRPLHAKLLTVSYRNHGVDETLVVMGSANMSRRALLLGAGPGQGNVELGVAFRLEGSHCLVDFASELVHVPPSVLDLKERDFPEVGHNYALAIDSVVHDPAARTLEVRWSAEAAELPFWRLAYDGEELARSEAPPTETLVIPNFALRQASAELILHVKGTPYPVPILVTDLVALPAAPGIALGLDELLMLLSRRIGTERAIEIAKWRKRGHSQEADPTEHDDLGIFFGVGFGPTDVFRAWWAVAEDLCGKNLSTAAFRLRLDGAMGVGQAWLRMLDSLHGEGPLSRPEVWFYGAELLRTLYTEVELSSVIDAAEKARVLRAFEHRLKADLSKVRFDGDEDGWVRRIQSFYGAVAP